MDYAKSHHLWRPLAAISAKEEVRSLINVPTTILMKLSTPAPTLKTSAATTVTSALSQITSSTLSDERNDVWQRLFYKNSSDVFAGTTDIDGYDLFDVSNLVMNGTICNVTFCSNDTTAIFTNPIWEVMTMIGTSLVLGLIILATVIGKLCVRTSRNLRG